MCGIFGFVAATERDASNVLTGLQHLEYRGYDSWGIAVTRDQHAITDKAVGQIGGAETHLPPSLVALGHTRWATHGGVTEANAHPHVDCGGRFALIHNGIVENYVELGRLLRRQHHFLSQTDTEVLVHLLEEELEREADLLLALLAVFKQVQGLSAVAVMDAQTGQIVTAKNGSPLVLGWGEDAMYLASDPIAMLDHTRSIAFLDDGQAAVLTPDGIRLYDIATGQPIPPDIRQVTWDTRAVGLDGHAHFMAKEIHEQPGMLRKIAGRKREDAEALARIIEAADDVYLIGCGTAYHAALAGRYMLAQIAGRSVTAVAASEMGIIAPLLRPKSLVIALSQSGETIDVLDAVRAARARGATIAALVNAEGSALDRTADTRILLDSGPERCVLATKSYTAKLAVLSLVAYALASRLEDGQAEIRDGADRVEALLERERSDGNIRTVASRVSEHQHLFILGRHRSYPQALEGALKIKEVSYLHAEGFASGELKHGVIALITNGTPCIIVASDAEYHREVLAAAAEVRARGAYTIGLSNRVEPEFESTLHVDEGRSSLFEVAVTFQLMAYELALLRGCDPDKPRNLAKSVTVK